MAADAAIDTNDTITLPSAARSDETWTDDTWTDDTRTDETRTAETRTGDPQTDETRTADLQTDDDLTGRGRTTVDGAESDTSALVNRTTLLDAVDEIRDADSGIVSLDVVMGVDLLGVVRLGVDAEVASVAEDRAHVVLTGALDDRTTRAEVVLDSGDAWIRYSGDLGTSILPVAENTWVSATTADLERADIQTGLHLTTTPLDHLFGATVVGVESAGDGLRVDVQIDRDLAVRSLPSDRADELAAFVSFEGDVRPDEFDGSVWLAADGTIERLELEAVARSDGGPLGDAETTARVDVRYDRMGADIALDDPPTGDDVVPFDALLD